MKKRIVSVVLTLVLLISMTTSAMASTKASNKTITFSSTGALPSSSQYAPATVKITNVTSQTTKDYSVYLSDDKVTHEGKKSKVITCKAPMTVTLQSNKGDKHVGVTAFSLYYDSNKISLKTVTSMFKYYAFDINSYTYDFSKKYTKPLDYCGYADGSSYTITKAGEYILYVKTVDDGYNVPEGLTPVFIVVK